MTTPIQTVPLTHQIMAKVALLEIKALPAVLRDEGPGLVFIDRGTRALDRSGAKDGTALVYIADKRGTDMWMPMDQVEVYDDFGASGGDTKNLPIGLACAGVTP